MTDYITYQTDRSMISQQNMQFDIINRHPNFSSNEAEHVKAEIEKQLYDVFVKYPCDDLEQDENNV